MPKGKELTIAVTVKTPDGKFVTRPYPVTGPIRLCSTLTVVQIGESLQNRCVTLTV